MAPVIDRVGTSLVQGAAAAERFARKLGPLRKELAAAAGRSRALTPTVAALRRIETTLRRPLRLAVLGESNSGKSTLTNLLLGIPVLPTLQVSNTRLPTLLVHGAQVEAAFVLPGGKVVPLTSQPPAEAGLVRVSLPLAHLRACEILDVPGFLDPLLGYDIGDISGYRIDAAVWCTFSTQAWKESERFSWLRLPPAARQYGLLAVTNMDRLRSDQAVKVMARLEKVARADFRAFAFVASPEAQGAFDAKGALTDAGRWQRSGMASLHETLGAMLRELRLDRLRKAQALTRRITEKALRRVSA